MDGVEIISAEHKTNEKVNESDMNFILVEMNASKTGIISNLQI